MAGEKTGFKETALMACADGWDAHDLTKTAATHTAGRA